jgi:hypothetical protein
MVASVSNTVLGIITDAMMDAGILQEGSDPNSEQLANNMRRLCDIVNLWQTQGCKLFVLEEMTIDLVDGTSSYTLTAPTVTPPSKHLRILQGRIETTDGVKRPVYPVSWDEWNRLSQSSDGSVVNYFVDKRATSLVIKVWNTPDASEAGNSLILLVQKQITNPINLTEDMTFPQEWRIALRWGLADDICTGQPQAIMDRCAERAKTYRTMLEDFDVEDTSTRFEADMQGYQGSSFL